MNALIAIGKTKTHRFHGHLYRRHEITFEGRRTATWYASSWRGWYAVDDRLNMQLEQDFRLHMQELSEAAADCDAVILS